MGSIKQEASLWPGMGLPLTLLPQIPPGAVSAGPVWGMGKARWGQAPWAAGHRVAVRGSRSPHHAGRGPWGALRGACVYVRAWLLTEVCASTRGHVWNCVQVSVRLCVTMQLHSHDHVYVCMFPGVGVRLGGEREHVCVTPCVAWERLCCVCTPRSHVEVGGRSWRADTSFSLSSRYM